MTTPTDFDQALRRCKAAFAATDRAERLQSAIELVKIAPTSDDPRADLALDFAHTAVLVCNGQPGAYSKFHTAYEQLARFEALLDDIAPPEPPTIRVI